MSCITFEELYEQLVELIKSSDEAVESISNAEYIRSFRNVPFDKRKPSQVIMNKPRNLVRKVIR